MGGGGKVLLDTDRNFPTSFVKIICVLDITTCSLFAYSKGILLVCAFQNQYYPFKTNKPDPIARLLCKNCPTFILSEQIRGGGGLKVKRKTTIAINLFALTLRC